MKPTSCVQSIIPVQYWDSALLHNLANSFMELFEFLLFMNKSYSS